MIRITTVGVAGLHDCLDQVVLRAQQVERIAIAEMVFAQASRLVLSFSPTTTMATSDFARRVGRGLNRRRLRLRVDQLDVVGRPAHVALRRIGDLAAFRVEDRCLVADAGANAVENAHALARDRGCIRPGARRRRWAR